MLDATNLDGRIRRASSDDVGAIARLAKRAQASDAIPRIDEDDIRTLLTRGEMIVLGLRPHELVAAACLTKAAGRGHLAFLVVDPAYPGLEDRIRGVAAALSDAEDCEPTFAPSLRTAS
jgi:N-acetylglutamate synthase-like GNAT family acetyltransferase